MVISFNCSIFGLIEGLFNYIGTEDTNDTNMAINQETRAWQEEMWNKQNLYNLPKNQMARLQAAGLNPNLVYGSGTSTLAGAVGNPATPIPSQNSLSGFLGKLDIVKAVTDLKNSIKIANSEANRNNAEAYKAEAEGDNISYQNETLPQKLQNELKIQGYEVSIKDLELFVKNQTYNDEIEIAFQSALKLQNENALTDAQRKILANDVLKGVQEIENLKKQGKLIDAQQSEVLSQAALNNASANYQNALAKLAPYQASLYKAQIFKEIEQAAYYGAESAKVRQESDKIANDIVESIYNGNVDRIKKLSEMYGANYINSIVNRARDAINKNETYKSVTRNKPTKSQYFFNFKKRKK